MPCHEFCLPKMIPTSRSTIEDILLDAGYEVDATRTIKGDLDPVYCRDYACCYAWALVGRPRDDGRGQGLE